MALSFRYFHLYFLSTVRNTPALFFTLIFPPLMLLLTAHQWGSARQDQIHAFVVFCNYSVQTVAFMVLGMAVSAEKHSQWSAYLRTLPVGFLPVLAGRTWHTLFLALINLLTISLVGFLFLSVPLNVFEWLYILSIALVGAIPMACLGMAIGYAANPESSRSIFTLCNLLLLFGSFSLPSTGFFGIVRQAIPSYQWSALSLLVIAPESVVGPLLCFAFYTVVAALWFRRSYAIGNV